MERITRTLHDFWRIINLQTAVVTAISIIATYLCLTFDVIIELPTGLIGIAIVFPIVFSINAAYRRREEALRYFASFKGHGIALYFAHRDWLPQTDLTHAQRMAALLNKLFAAVQVYFAKDGDLKAQFEQVYAVFSEMSLSMEALRKAGVSSGETSRQNQYLRAMMIEFERMHHIHQYRTPTALRAYSQVFLNSFPILFAPYFASLSQEAFPLAGYGLAAFYGLILVSLDNIQDHLENPYDQHGQDDVTFNAEKFTDNLG